MSYSFQKTVLVTPTAWCYPHSIQDGISKLNGQPGIVYVESGDYHITSSLERIRLPDNTSLIGLGKVNIYLDTPLSTALIDNVGLYNINLSNINIVVSDNAAPYSQNLVFFNNTRNSKIEDVNVTAESVGNITGGVAILLNARDSECKNNIIRHCRVTFYNGIAFYMATHPVYEPPMPDTCNHNLITECHTYYCTLGCGLLRASDNSIINNNFIYSTGHEAGHAGILAGESNRLRIIGNNLSHNAEHGLYLSGCKDSIIHGNACNNNWSAGMHVRFAGTEADPIDDCRNVIDGNTCNYNGYNQEGGGVPSPGGEIYIGGNGIHLQEYANHNVISNNVCHKNASNGIRIHLAGATKNIVTGNICYENVDTQVLVQTEGNIVSNNQVE